MKSEISWDGRGRVHHRSAGRHSGHRGV